MIRIASAAALTALALALSACSSTSFNDEPEINQAADAESEKSVSQWASKISQITYDVDSTYTEYRDDACSASTVDLGDTTCQLQLTLMTVQAQTLGIEADMMTNPTHENYMGEPPEEVRDLADETIEVIAEVASSAEAVDCPGDGCFKEAFKFESNMKDLRQKLTGWSPYS